MFCCSGILFNHESPRRGFNFVTKKIVNGLEAVGAGRQECLTLGNLTALRDWGHAKDYVEAMWLMLQQDTPDDFVIATGEQYTVKQFVEHCAPYFALKIRWEGEGLNEVGIDTNTNRVVIRVDPKYFRPAEVQTLLGDSTKARSVLGWQPKHSFDDLVEDMCMNFGVL
jgi:GDPmannose 4,6-dehydratase